jgi:fructose/tagatose bisphosphate aldolase
MIVTTKQLYKVAYGKFAVGAYNVNNMEQILGLFRGNVQSQAPFIIQLSKGARKYADKRMLEALIRTAEKMFTEAIFAVTSIMAMKRPATTASIPGFYSSVMIDASHEAFDENHRYHQTRRGPRAPERASASRRSWVSLAAWRKISKSTRAMPSLTKSGRSRWNSLGKPGL